MRRTRVALAAVTAIAAVALAVPWPQAVVESAFSSTLYPPWQRVATTATNALPFAAFDVILAAAIAVLIGSTIASWRRSRGGRGRRAGAAVLTALAVIAASYLWFSRLPKIFRKKRSLLNPRFLLVLRCLTSSSLTLPRLYKWTRPPAADGHTAGAATAQP